MTRRILCLAVMLLGMGAQSAAAQTTIVEPAGSHFPYQRWIDEAKIPTPAINITLEETSMPFGCPGRTTSYVACTTPSEGRIWIAPEALVGLSFMS